MAAKYESLNMLLESVQFTLLIFTIGMLVVHVTVHLPWLSFLASVLPAASGALGSVAGQAEVVRLRDRALSMHRAIERKRRELAVAGSATSCESLRGFVEATAQQLLGESLEWRVLFKFRPMSSPG